MMNSHPISCLQCTLEQSTFCYNFKEIKELFEKLIKDVQDLATQVKQMKSQTDSIGKPRMTDHNKIIVALIEDNIDDEILVVEKHQVSIMLEGAYDEKVEFVEYAINQPSIMVEDLQLGEVEEVETAVIPMVLRVQDEIILISHIDFVISEEFDVVDQFKFFVFCFFFFVFFVFLFFFVFFLCSLRWFQTWSKCYLSTS